MPIKTGAQLIAEAKQRVRETSVVQVREMQAHGVPAVYLDVREQNEWNLGHLPQATFMPRGVLETTIEQRVPRDTAVVIYCASGNRSALAAETLQEMGYANVSHLSGGFRAWVEGGGDVDG
jgi:rhodanese-related sulfurtransferase